MTTVTEGGYDAMHRETRLDPRNAIAQALNVGHALVIMAWRMTVGTPLAMFWLASGATFFAPEEFGRTIDAFAGAWRGAGGTDVAICAMQDLLAASALIAGLGIVALAAAKPARLGLQNHCAKVIARALRRRCNSPEVGHASVRCEVTNCGEAHVLGT